MYRNIYNCTKIYTSNNKKRLRNTYIYIYIAKQSLQYWCVFRFLVARCARSRLCSPPFALRPPPRRARPKKAFFLKVFFIYRKAFCVLCALAYVCTMQRGAPPSATCSRAPKKRKTHQIRAKARIYIYIYVYRAFFYC